MWRSCSGSSSTYPLVMIGVIGNILHSTAKMCQSTIKHVPYSFSRNSQIKCFLTHVDVDIFSCFGMWNSCPKFVHAFQLHPLCNFRFHHREKTTSTISCVISLPSLCVYISVAASHLVLLGNGMVARQWLGKHVPVTMNTHATTEELLGAPFSVWSMLYYRKVGD
jgi:hypothetical protein